MARTSRRGKIPKEPKPKNDSFPNNIPSKILSSILKNLDLSFERDIGMLNGKNVRNIPERKKLIDLQKDLNVLNDLFSQISKSDGEFIEKIRQIKDEKLGDAKAIEDNNNNENIEKEKEQRQNEELKYEETKDKENANNKKSNADVMDTTDRKTQAETDIKESSTIANPEKETEINEDDKVSSETKETNNVIVSDELTTNIEKEPFTLPENINSNLVSISKEENQEKADAENNKKRKLDSIEATEVNNISTTGDTNADIEETTDDISKNKKIKLEEPATPTVPTPQPSISSNATETIQPPPTVADKRIPNPKSEFVVSQTLPQAARDLGLYNEEGLETTGEEYLKKKYNVASYPTDDLKELLAGELPDLDFSCPKPTNQIQYNTFLTFVENFLRDLTDDDIKFLKEKYVIPSNLKMEKLYDANITPFIIPKLGPLYTNTWSNDENDEHLGNKISPVPLKNPTSILPKKSASDVNDSFLETEDISCGPLLTRLLSAILKDENDNNIVTHNDNNNKQSEITIKQEGNLGDDNTKEMAKVGLEGGQSHESAPPSVSTIGSPQMMDIVGDQTDGSISSNNPVSLGINGIGGGTTSTLKNEQAWNINSINLDYPTFEERLKRELKYVGIYMNLPKDEINGNGDDPDWLNGREDDEISAELRSLQSSLKQVTCKNQNRKNILLPLLERQLAWQEYSSILDDLDKQVDQAYIKRIRAPKKKKKHHTSSTNSSGSHSGNAANSSQLAQQKAANSSLRALLDKRQRWINTIGPLFDSPQVMKRIPKVSVFKDIDQEEDEEDGDDVFAQNNEGKEEVLAET